jgi:hypothetical protein
MDSDFEVPKRQSNTSKSKRPSASLLNPLLSEEKPSNNSVARPVSKDDQNVEEAIQNPLVFTQNHKLETNEDGNHNDDTTEN